MTEKVHSWELMICSLDNKEFETTEFKCEIFGKSLTSFNPQSCLKQTVIFDFKSLVETRLPLKIFRLKMLQSQFRKLLLNVINVNV